MGNSTTYVPNIVPDLGEGNDTLLRYLQNEFGSVSVGIANSAIIPTMSTQPKKVMNGMLVIFAKGWSPSGEGLYVYYDGWIKLASKTRENAPERGNGPIGILQEGGD